MFKKVCVFALLYVLGGCFAPGVSTQSGVRDSASEIDEETFSGAAFRVGVLLPLSGGAAKYGQGLKNAALMAYDDLKNENLLLQFYDTNSSASGAAKAAQTAIKQNVRMIVGPLSSAEVAAVSEEALDYKVPVLAFSTDSSVLQNGVYTFGLLVEEQVERIVSYATAKGRSKLALLIPDNTTGISVAKAAVASAGKNGADIVRIAFYEPNTTDFSEILKQLTDFENRSAKIGVEKTNLRILANAGDDAAKKQLARLRGTETDFGVDFDAVLIPESGGKLKSIAAMFGYYDVFAPDVKFLGTTVWGNTNLSKESTMSGSWYPALSQSHSSYFNRKYNSLFGQYPASLYAFAYDAVALSSILAKQRPANLNLAVTNPDGFSAISGVFRINPNGKSEHSLDIMQIGSGGDVVVDEAPKKFGNEPDLTNPVSWYDGQVPLIFGKDPEIARELIFSY